MTVLADAWTHAMRRGDFRAAWAIAGQALVQRDSATRDDATVPYHLRWVWDGRPVDGLDVLVRCYHGLGDTLQFARFLPHLRARARSVTVEMQPRLIPLFRDAAGIDRLIPFDLAQPAPPSDCDIEIMELPLALRVAPDEAPPPYLPAPPDEHPHGCVALCLQAGDWDAARSVPETLCAPLCAGPTLSLDTVPSSLPVLNPEGCPMDLQRTAALVANAALVITVDTMIAHLAGALGRPTWVMLKHDPDWRWPADAARTPWYSSMRLYHQPAPGDWAAVVSRVAADLSRKHLTPDAPARDEAV